MPNSFYLYNLFFRHLCPRKLMEEKEWENEEEEEEEE
jgi:hypothetical protein